MKNFKEYVTQRETSAHGFDAAEAFANDLLEVFANDFANFLVELEKKPDVNPTRPVDLQKAKEDLLAKLKSNRQLRKDLKTSIWENFHDWAYLYGKEQGWVPKY